MKHYLKTVSPHFEDVDEGRKTFEVRFDDRKYKVGDILVLQHYIPPVKNFNDDVIKYGSFTGRQIAVRVTHILKDPKYVKHGYVIMSIK